MFPLPLRVLIRTAHGPLALLAALGTLLGQLPDASGATTEELLAPVGELPLDKFGHSVGTAGDINGDGFADVIVGAPINGAAGVEAGRAYVFLGGPQADDVPDLVLTGEASGDQFGTSVGTTGDVNNDGFDDFIVGAPYYDGFYGTDAGRAYVYFGSAAPDSIPDLILDGEYPEGGFGFAVGMVIDITGDGHDDIVVGAPSVGVIQDFGWAYIFEGGPGLDTIPDRTLFGGTGDTFGASLANAGDFNLDGFDDLLVGAPTGASDKGEVYLFLGGPGMDSQNDFMLTGESSLTNYATTLAGGDVNGDGASDIVVGASLAGIVGRGKIFVYFGGAAADTSADLIFTGEDGEELGTSVATCDANGDGFVDIVAGARYAEGYGYLAGRVVVHFGGPSLDTLADLVFTGKEAYEHFGTSVGNAGDVDGDGRDDVIGGAPYRDSGFLDDVGGMDVYSSYSYRLLTPGGGATWVAGQHAVVRWQGNDPADVSISVNGGLTWDPLATGVSGPSLEVIAPAPTELALVRLTYTGQIPGPSNSVVSSGAFRVVRPAAPAAHVLGFAPTGEAADDKLGGSVAGAGDVNGDGFDDYLVGALGSGANGPFAGRAYLHLGGPSTSAVPDLVFDGEAAGDNFGTVAGVGDVNGDGFDDWLIGALLNAAAGTDAGRAYLYLGGASVDTVRDLTLTAEAPGDEFGWALSGAGDVNGDGYSDFVIGAYFNDAGGADAGRAYVYYGGPGWDEVADLVLTGTSAGELLGVTVTGAGDVNGDGFDDVLVGASGAEGNTGRAYLFFGGASPDTIADLVLIGEEAGDIFGDAIAGVGDVNGDGYGDFLVGARLNDAGGENTGRAYLYLGETEPDGVADLVLTGYAPGDFLGNAVAGLGDSNGDGFDDFLVGAWFADGADTDLGQAYVFYGAPIPDKIADLVVTGEASVDRFAVTVASAGDVTGDGFPDILVGADRNDAGGSDAGRAYLYDCNRYHVLSPTASDTWNVGAAEAVSWLGAEPADVWLSVDGGVSYSLLRDNAGGQTSNSVSLTVPHRPTRFAKVKVTPSAATVTGVSESDSLFTIEANIVLLNLSAASIDGGGVLLSWETDPGPADLAGYKIERSPSGDDSWQTLASLIRDTEYHDATGTTGMRYRLTGINGLGEELLLGETALAPQAALSAWPLPYRGGALNLSFATYGGRTGAVKVAIYDMQGRLVRTLVDGTYPTGHQTVTWDGRDASGRDVSSGVYFLRGTSAGESNQIKLLVVR